MSPLDDRHGRTAVRSFAASWGRKQSVCFQAGDSKWGHSYLIGSHADIYVQVLKLNQCSSDTLLRIASGITKTGLMMR